MEPHPHRGFSPVTFVFKGSVHHRDSFGNDAVVQAGGTQWMHAGRGVTHSERPSKSLAENGGEQEFIQFWVNTPAKHKMETPYYLPLSDEGTPKINKYLYTLGIVAGEYHGINGPAKTYSPQTLLRADAQSDAAMAIDLPQNFNTLVYLLDGKLNIDGQTAAGKDLIWFNNDVESIDINVIEDTRFIVLSGKPIGEPVSSYGPFVMNTETEILEALKDAQIGKMGILIEEF